MKIDDFRRQIWSFYHEQGRRLAWRETRDPYAIVVSEIMLQQTQVERVAQKYPLFLQRFPDFTALAAASVAEVLAAWQGLGYNRRALYLLRLAQQVQSQHGGILPADLARLKALPGIGAATAASILAFAFNQPVIFIETNIRRVFLHSFFPGEQRVHDTQLLPLIEAALDRENPREWYYALMDFGSALKKKTANPNRRSAHYQRQSKFAGSVREMRGNIVRYLLDHRSCDELTLQQLWPDAELRIRTALEQLTAEGFLICDRSGRYALSETKPDQVDLAENQIEQ